MGSSRGRFEGDTLVIETRELPGRTSVGGAPNSAQHARYRAHSPRDPPMIEYRVTINGPETCTAPFTLRTIWTDAAGLRGARVLVPRGQRRRGSFAPRRRAWLYLEHSKSPTLRPRALPVLRRVSTTIKSATAPADGQRYFDINAGE